MIEIPPWYVITGGPSSGKTTLLERLHDLGYNTVPEAARVLIDEYEAKGIPAKDLRKDERLFQQRVLQMKLKIEEETPRDRVVFFDRGVPDSIGYFLAYGWNSGDCSCSGGLTGGKSTISFIQIANNYSLKTYGL